MQAKSKSSPAKDNAKPAAAAVPRAQPTASHLPQEGSYDKGRGCVVLAPAWGGLAIEGPTQVAVLNRASWPFCSWDSEGGRRGRDYGLQREESKATRTAVRTALVRRTDVKESLRSARGAYRDAS
jgi:hypothetical protein